MVKRRDLARRVAHANLCRDMRQRVLCARPSARPLPFQAKCSPYRSGFCKIFHETSQNRR